MSPEKPNDIHLLRFLLRLRSYRRGTIYAEINHFIVYCIAAQRRRCFFADIVHIAP